MIKIRLIDFFKLVAPSTSVFIKVLSSCGKEDSFWAAVRYRDGCAGKKRNKYYEYIVVGVYAKSENTLEVEIMEDI